MSRNVQPRSASRKFAPAGFVFALLGVLLFAYFVWRAGPGEIWGNISKLGAGFVLILLLSGLRFAVRAFVWTLCFEPPHRLSFRDAFAAYLIGDTAGNVVPLGLVVSEPTKVAAVRDRVPLGAAVSAIAVENLFYMLSVAVFIFSGAAALLLSFPLPKVLRWSSYGILAGVVAALLFASFAVWRQWRFVSGALERAASRGPGGRLVGSRRERVRAVEDRIYGFFARNGRRFLPIMLLEAGFHVLGVAEAYLTILFISDLPPTLLTAFLFESVNRVITMVFKFVPLRAGVDELGSGQLARVLSFGEAAGVTLAIVRKARMLFWMSVGVALLVGRGLSLRAVAAEAARADDDEQARPRAADPAGEGAGAL